MIPNARILSRIFLGLALAGSATTLLAQSGVISSDSLTPFSPRDVGTTSEVKTVRVRLNHPLALTSVAIAPGFTEFSIGTVTGCAIDGNTINPVFTVCEVPVTFAPKYPGIRTAPLVVTDNTGTKYSIGLVGTGLAPQVAFTPGILSAVKDKNGANFPANTVVSGVAVDGAGNIYASQSQEIDKMTPDGVVSTVATRFFSRPGSLAVNAKGEVIYTDGEAIKKIDLNGQIIHVAGTGVPGYSGDGGPATNAQIHSGGTPIAVDAEGNIYISDLDNFRIRKVDTNGIITTVAGTGTGGYSGDGGPATAAEIGFAQGVAVDQAGNLYFSDYNAGVIRKVDTNGIITTIAGTGTWGTSGDEGPAIKAQLAAPGPIIVDAAQNIYFLQGSAFIRRIDALGWITTIARGGFQNPVDGVPADQAGSFETGTIALDSAGNLYLNFQGVGKIDVSKSAASLVASTLGTPGPVHRIVLTNTGNQHLDLGALDVAAPFGLLSGNDPSYCSTNPDIGSGFSCALPVTFTPSASGQGPFTGSVTVTDNSLNQPGTAHTVALTATEVPPQLAVISSGSLTPFESRNVGSASDVKGVRVLLNYPLAISSIAIAPGFTEFSMGAVSGCAVDGHTVNPAFTVCQVQVTFNPKYPGLRTAPLIVTNSTGLKFSIGLQGTGVAPQAALTPGIITTLPGFTPAQSTSLGGNITIDAAGNLYIAETSANIVHKLDVNGALTTVAGNGTCAFSGDGGPATSASICRPTGVAVDAAGNLYIANAGIDNNANRIRKVDINGTITTIAGSKGFCTFDGDGGPATSASLCFPQGLAVDPAGNLYIADELNNRIRKIDVNAIITTVAGSGQGAGFAGDGGPATRATLNAPYGVALDSSGNLYFADMGNSRIRKVDTSGIITTVAGNGQSTGHAVNGLPATHVPVPFPREIALDAAGNLYFPDGNLIHRVDSSGIIRVITGNGTATFSGDNGPATQAGLRPNDIALDAAGNLYVLDNTSTSSSDEGRIRKVNVSQSAAIFAAQNVGTMSSSQRLALTNTGNQHLNLAAPGITGDFNLIADPVACATTPDLGIGLSCSLPITFAPTAAGTLTGAATVTDNSLNQSGATQTVGLSGTGVNP